MLTAALSGHDLDGAERARLSLGGVTQVVGKRTTGSDVVAAVLEAVREHVLERGGPAATGTSAEGTPRMEP